MKKIDQYITSYISELEERKGRSMRTVRNYDFYLRRFLSWLEKNKVESLEKITEPLIKKYKSWLAEYEDPIKKVVLKKSTQNYHLIALRGFLEYVSRQKVKTISYNRVKLDKTSKKRVDYLKKDELVELLESPMDYKQDKIIQLRDNAILEILFSTGMKVSELSKLKRSQLKIDGNKFEGLNRKGLGDVGLTNQATQALKKYLRVRKDKEPFLFIGHDRAISDRKKIKGLSPRSVERVIEKYAKFIDLKRRITPQIIRHTYVINQLMKGISLEKLQKQLGFKDPAALKAYIKRF